jgi:hypothetical protein
MSDEKARDRLYQMVDEALLAGNEDSVHNLFNGVASRAKSECVEIDGPAILEYFWRLARIGAVAVPGDALHVLTFKMPHLLLTDRGRQLLEKKELAPHNSSKYLAAVRRRVEQPDEVALSYLCEAVEAWSCGLNRSSAVMLGCACERLVLILAEAIFEAHYNPWSGRIADKFKKRVFISGLFDEVRDALLHLKGEKKLPQELGNALDRKLSAIFDHARGLRNESGHPTDESVSAEDAEAGLLLFPGFYDLVGKIITSIRAT